MRYIDCEVNDEYVIGSGVVIGASGSHNDVGLRLKFGDMWVGLNIYATFTDANGEGSAVVMLMPSMLVPGEAMTYLLPIPAEAKKYPGKAMLTLSGFSVINGTQVDKATNTVTAFFRVLKSNYRLLTDSSVTPTLAQQLQNEMGHAEEVALEAMADSAAAAEMASEAKMHAQELSNHVSDLDTSQAAILKAFQRVKDKINSFLDVEDEAFDQLSEILKLIENNNIAFETDETLSLVNGVLSVNTAEEPDPDNTLPITAAAVASTVGNIEIILKTI